MASFLPEIVLPYFGCKNSGLAIVYLPNPNWNRKKTSRHNNRSIKRGGQTDGVVKKLGNQFVLRVLTRPELTCLKMFKHFNGLFNTPSIENFLLNWVAVV